MPKKILLIANNGPEDPNRATVPLLTAKALVESGNKVFIWLYKNAKKSDKRKAIQPGQLTLF
jgi:predicted peroxiredoxin